MLHVINRRGGHYTFSNLLSHYNKREKRKKKKMASNFSSLVIVFLSLLFVAALANQNKVLPTWRPIQNLKDPEVLRIANFAVTEHNKEAKTNLTFVAVLKGETIVVAGLRYKLVISAKDGDSARNYPAEVWSKPWLKFQQLISFGKLLTN